MYVTIRGKKVAVSVSDGGIFFDMETQATSSTTLKGLKKKLLTNSPLIEPIPIQKKGTYKNGVIRGRSNNSYYYRVTWEDGSVTESEYGQDLMKPQTEEQRAAKLLLIADVETKRNVLRAAEIVLSTFNKDNEFLDLDKLVPKG